MNWEYISGFFDADGHITLSAMNKGKNKTICVGFTNIDLKLLEDIKEFIDIIYGYWLLKTSIPNITKKVKK